MLVSQKCQYAIRAIFELAKRLDEGPAPIAEIAEAQAIPKRFLEVILNELRQAGFVESQRGSRGGYVLAHLPRRLTVGEIVRFVEGPIGPVECVSGGAEKSGCPLHRDCVFLPMWERVQQAISEVYDSTTFADLLEDEERRRVRYVPSYTI
ncbi:MAG: Rrf2 family transcriptional regulator [Planctomycetota bacterium]